MRHALFDAFLFESASEKQQFLYRLNPRLVNAEDAGPIPFDDSADVHPRQTIHVHQAQHFALLRIRQPLDRRPHRVLLKPLADRRERVDVKLIRSLDNPVRRVLFGVYFAARRELASVRLPHSSSPRGTPRVERPLGPQPLLAPSAARAGMRRS